MHHAQLWTLKKNEEAAAKKKPKTSAAQIRVQKGLWRFQSDYDRIFNWSRSHRAGLAIDDEDELPRPCGSAQLHTDDNAR